MELILIENGQLGMDNWELNKNSSSIVKTKLLILY